MSTFTELDAFVTHVFRTKAGHVYGVTLNSGTLNVGDMIAITDNDDVWEVEVTQIRRYRESMATFGPAEALSYMGDARECGLVFSPDPRVGVGAHIRNTDAQRFLVFGVTAEDIQNGAAL